MKPLGTKKPRGFCLCNMKRDLELEKKLSDEWLKLYTLTPEQNKQLFRNKYERALQYLEARKKLDPTFKFVE